MNLTQEESEPKLSAKSTFMRKIRATSDEGGVSQKPTFAYEGGNCDCVRWKTGFYILLAMWIIGMTVLAFALKMAIIKCLW